MAFDITPCGLVLRPIIWVTHRKLKSDIVAPQQVGKRKIKTFASKSSVEPAGANKSRILFLGSSLRGNFDSRLVKKKRMDFGKYM